MIGPSPASTMSAAACRMADAGCVVAICMLMSSEACRLALILAATAAAVGEVIEPGPCSRASFCSANRRALL